MTIEVPVPLERIQKALDKLEELEAEEHSIKEYKKMLIELDIPYIHAQ